MIAYIATFLLTFAVLIFLKFCEGSPFRSWKSVVLTGIPLALLAGYYFNHAFPRKAAPLPQAEKASAYKMELERTWRRIAGVDGISIEGRTVQIDFADYKPISDLKQLARQFAGNAAYFLKTNNQPVRVTVKISLRGKPRYEMEYQSDKGVLDEQEF